MTYTDPDILYRWSCPYCNASRVTQGTGDEREVRNRAKNALTGHVYASDDAEHGPRNTAPADFGDPEQYIERITSE